MARVPTRTHPIRTGNVGAIAAQAGRSRSSGGSQVYRYEDAQGRVVYSDRAPPADAKKSESKRVSANFVETDTTPLATQQATDRFPVTLYTFACGDVCQSAEALLNRRGVPFTSVNVEEPANAARLQALTGAMTGAGAVQVGDNPRRQGLQRRAWTTMLDEPATRR
jgi:hypothetical protein